jgi:hypothetical protein
MSKCGRPVTRTRFHGESARSNEHLVHVLHMNNTIRIFADCYLRPAGRIETALHQPP